ncbi:MAG: multidrug efflux SMR transporter [Proteobacteria bacterium]|nr:MAG: multidrug efflux SMR transporter [Pseudomonadota bacterium]
MSPWIYLSIAILLECIATSSLKASEGFTRLIPSIIAALGYIICFYTLSLGLKDIPLGIAYAIWSGAGILILTLVGYFYFKQAIDLPAAIGIGFILTGVLIINVFSKTAQH